VAVSSAASGRTSPPAIVYVAAAVAALGALLFGYDTGVISGAILFVRQDAQLTGGIAMSPGLEEVVVSAVLLGAVIGAAVGGALSDRLGRRWTLILAGATFIGGALGCMLAPSVSVLIAFRVLVGVAIGGASLMVPMYISELAPAHIRGMLVSINQVALIGGILVAYVADYALSGTGNWRAMFGLAVIPAALLMAGMVFMPESPRWLMAHGRADEARRVLARMRGGGDVGAEIDDIRHSLSQQGGGLREVVAPAVRPALIIGVVLAVLQQVTGINTVLYYAPTIVEDAGLSSAGASLLATIGVGVANLLATIVALTLIDRLGRRPLLLTSLAGMALSLGMLGVVLGHPGLIGAGGGAAVVAMMLYVMAFAIGLGPVFWLLIAEIYPLKVRGTAMSIATLANWGANLIVALTFLTLIDLLGRPETFWLYGALSVCAVVFVYLRVPETKGRSLEEIEAAWRTGTHAAAAAKPPVP